MRPHGGTGLDRQRSDSFRGRGRLLHEMQKSDRGGVGTSNGSALTRKEGKSDVRRCNACTGEIRSVCEINVDVEGALRTLVEHPVCEFHPAA